MGIFNPLYDPLSPSADYYGIVFRIVRANPGFDSEREFGSLYAELIEIGDALGFEPIDVEATEGRAMVPCTPWNCAGNLGGSVLELSSIYHAGSPIITGDGMTRAGIAALVAAEAVIAGEDPAYHANRALAKWNAANRGLTYAMTGFARLMAVMMRLAPSRALSVADQPDFWAGVE